MDFSEPQQLLNDLSTSLFGGGYGDKLFPSTIQIHPSFEGSISYQGFEHVTLEGNFSDTFFSGCPLDLQYHDWRKSSY